MNLVSLGRPVNFAQQGVCRIRHSPSASGYLLLFSLIACFCAEPELRAQQAAGQTPAEQLAALQLERTNAWQRVLQIVNQPVTAYARTPNYPISIYSPGWFHEGAIKPDFNTVDVRKSQELPYASHQYVSSDLNPLAMFLGRDLEFNAMTKLFYTNRSLPKHKLKEAEMIEINQLYRTIGRCEREIERLQAPPATETAQLSDTESGSTPAGPGHLLAAIGSIPQKTRLFYGGIAIGVLVLLVLASRLFGRKPD